eukprot:494728_1
MTRIQFAKYVRGYTKIKTAYGGRLYRQIMNKMKNETQKKQFGEYLSGLNMNEIDHDYYHILQVHINNGNKTTIKNTFRFFPHVVHFEDSDEQTKQCRSAKRSKERINELKSQNKEEKKTENDVYNIKSKEQKNIWELKEYYNQSQLDMIHSFLVHSNWQFYVERHSDITDHNNDELKHNEQEIQNKSKYISDLSANESGYGFGVDHCHPHLSPVHASIYDELLFNKLCALNEKQFQNLLTKAIKLHSIIKTDENNHGLICKYYHPQYNIIRNEIIGLRHICTIAIYTDMTNFCTAYRKTYRKIDNETTEQQVTRRHCQLYYYSRCLFEAIEFFGQFMEPNMKVYHGLTKVMHFEKFSAYFNQPISTTKSIATAQNFSGGTGIILKFKSAADYLHNSTKTPKYLAVSWMSNFPKEDEKLFYGLYVAFIISDIIEAQNMKSHSKELLMLNKFQKTVQNQKPYWDEDKDKQKIKALVELITMHQNKEKIESSSIKSKYITTYGAALFTYFCDNPNTTFVIINNYKSLPTALKNALFFEKNTCTNSFVPLTKLFKYLKRIVLTQLDTQQMTTDANDYLDIVLKYINSTSKLSETTLEKITFMSQQHRDRKENSTIKKLVNKYFKSFHKYQWSVRYEFQNQHTHNLIFTNNTSIINQNAETMSISMPIIKDTMAKSISFSEIYSPKNKLNNQIPSYFMQVLSVDEDEFVIQVTADTISDKKQKLVIREIGSDNNGSSARVRIEKNQISATTYFDTDLDDKHDGIYNLAIYDRKNNQEPLPNSTQIQVIILKDKTELPPLNKNFRPNCIDLSTILKVKDDQYGNIYVYWSIPPKCFGNISYRVFNELTAESEIIESLPYLISTASTPVSLQVVTINNVGDQSYESNPSKSIIIGSKDPKMQINDNAVNNEEKRNDNENVWSCIVCTYNNNTLLSYCELCGNKKPEVKHEVISNVDDDFQQIVVDNNHNIAIASGKDENENQSDQNHWGCSICTYHNNKSLNYCELCGNEKPIENNNNDNKSPIVLTESKTNLTQLQQGMVVGNSGIFECKEHGNAFLGYKCKYCCQMSTSVCWSNTHLCAECVNDKWKASTTFQTGKNRKTIEKYPQCDGLKVQINSLMETTAWNKLSRGQKDEELNKLCSVAELCPLGIEHPPNGFEYCLGCTLCADKQTELDNKKAKDNVERQLREQLAAIGLFMKNVDSGTQFSHNHPMDENGILFFLGTKGTRDNNKYVNPAELGLIIVNTSAMMSDSCSPVAFVGRNCVGCATKPFACCWFSIDFVDKYIIPTHYTLRHYSSEDT